MQQRQRRRKGDNGLHEVTRTRTDGTQRRFWCLTVDLGRREDGRRRVRKFYGESPRAAKQKYDDERARNGGTIPRAERRTVQSFLEWWLDEVGKANASTTRTFYEGRLKRFAYPNIGKLRLDAVDPPVISQLYNRLLLGGTSADNVRKLNKALRAAFNHAIGQGYIRHNPCDHVKLPQHKPSRGKGLTAIEVLRLWRAADELAPRYAALVYLGTTTTCRPGELFALKWSDVDLENGSIRVAKALRNNKGKLTLADTKTDLSERTIPLIAPVVDRLRAHRIAMESEGHGSPHVFPTPRGKFMRRGGFWAKKVQAKKAGSAAPEKTAAPASQPKIWPDVLAKAELAPMHPYDLRHTAISLFAEAGVDQRVVADLAGQSTTRLTNDVYTHISPAKHLEGVARLAALLGGDNVATIKTH